QDTDRKSRTEGSVSSAGADTEESVDIAPVALPKRQPGSGRREHIETPVFEEEERCYAIFQDAPTGNYLASTDGAIITCNKTFIGMFGFRSREDAVGTNIASLYPRPRMLEEAIEQLGKSRKISNQRLSLRRRNG